jgi:hypothetical protein
VVAGEQLIDPTLRELVPTQGISEQASTTTVGVRTGSKSGAAVAPPWCVRVASTLWTTPVTTIARTFATWV